MIDVQAKRRYAQQQAIINKYTPFLNQRVGPYTASCENARGAMDRELREMESRFAD
jgi:hypothetical protein